MWILGLKGLKLERRPPSFPTRPSPQVYESARRISESFAVGILSVRNLPIAFDRGISLTFRSF